MNDFTQYVLSFYGDDGIYDIGASQAEVEQATDLLKNHPDFATVEFLGDSFDREMTRDIILLLRERNGVLVDEY